MCIHLRVHWYSLYLLYTMYFIFYIYYITMYVYSKNFVTLYDEKGVTGATYEYWSMAAYDFTGIVCIHIFNSMFTRVSV